MTPRPHPPRPGPRRRARGAALLVAMVLLTLVATLATGMVWQQWRAVQVEAAERARTQSAWILNGALDWARLILREDARTGGADHLGEPWAVPLAEARLSTFLAADRDNNADGGPEAFLSGTITDAQSRYNLRNLVEDAKVAPAELAILQRLCELVAVPADAAERIARGLLAASGVGDAEQMPLPPRTVSDLAWLGLDAGVMAALRPHVELLPQRTPINLNTASREVIAAALEGMDLGTADRLVQVRQREPFKTLDAVRPHVPQGVVLDIRRVGVSSSHFEIRGRLRLDDRLLEERTLVERRGLDIAPFLRERVSSLVP